MIGYDYPPSKNILSYGPFQPDSHYCVCGVAKFDHGEFECDFEVAYTHGCRVIVVCYMRRSSAQEAFYAKVRRDNKSSHYVLRDSSRSCEGFTGIDYRSGLQIDVSHSVLVREPLWPVELSSVFFAESYTVAAPKGHPLHGEDSFPPTFELVGMRYFDHSSVLFDVNAASKLEFRIRVKQSDIEFDNQVTADLLVPQSSIPTSWTDEAVADLWCALVSLAVGSDVQWITKTSHSGDATQYKRVRRRYVSGKQFIHPFIENDSLFLMRDRVSKFVRKCFASIVNNRLSCSACKDYVIAIRHFIEYRLITSRAEDQARLITTTVEELLTHWEQHTGNVPNPKFSFKKRLTHLFTRNNHGKPITADMESRISEFINTRNSIVHDGQFPKAGGRTWQDDYYNMLMILPLMVFALFEYDGDYIDLTKLKKR